MSLLHSNRPLSGLQQRVNRTALSLLALAGVALGWWEAKECAAIYYGYAAGYSFGIAVFLAVSLSTLGLLLTIYWRTRWFGCGLIAAGILSCAVFYGGIYVLLKQDRVAWQHEPPMVSIGPDAEASAVIYFRAGISSPQVEDFNSSVLMLPAKPSDNGRAYPPFVQEYLRLIPSQANGHEAIALTFFKNAPADKTTAYLTIIKADSRVEKVFLNMSPDSIKPDSNPP